MSSRTVIFGAGHHGRVVLETLRAQGNFEVVGFLDDKVPEHTFVNGVSVLGGTEWATANVYRLLSAIVAIGNNDVRIAIGNQLARKFALINVIHPSAVVMANTQMGVGNLVCAGAVIVTGTRLEDGVIINTGATIDHDSVLHAGAQVAAGVHTAGCVTIGRGAFIGIGAVIGPGVTIGDRCVVGAGSVVLSDLPPGVLALGTPARIIEQLAEPVDWHKILNGRRQQ